MSIPDFTYRGKCPQCQTSVDMKIYKSERLRKAEQLLDLWAESFFCDGETVEKCEQKELKFNQFVYGYKEFRKKYASPDADRQLNSVHDAAKKPAV